MHSRQRFGLPLLSKELIEQSARRRTYIVRSLYAVLFFGFALMIFWGTVYSDVETPFELMGRGREMFTILMSLQIFGVCLFTPALTCGGITSEKEHNTIGLLFLTKLTPLTIVLEKYLGRLVVMGTYLLISLPLFGFCYALGGVEQTQVWFGFYGLIVTVCQLAALGILCSTYFRTTVSSFIATYLLGFLMFFGPIILFGMFRHRNPNSLGPGPLIWTSVETLVSLVGSIGEFGLNGLGELCGLQSGNNFVWEPVWGQFSYNRTEENGFIFFAPILLMSSIEGGPSTIHNWQLLALGFPALGLTFYFLLLSRLLLVPRAVVTPKRYLLLLFQVLDRLFHRANQNKVTQGIVLIRDGNKLPDYEPIAWRETTKTALGSLRYLVRIGLVIEFPVLFICLLAVTFSAGNMYAGNRNEVVAFITCLCWVLAILLTVVRSATLISSERSHETLDVLLTTPISSRQFVMQKYQGVKRLLSIVSIPLLTSMAMQAWHCSGYRSSRSNGWVEVFVRYPERSTLFYILTSLASVLIMLPLFAWLSMLIGMWAKTSTRAIFTALAVIVAWMIVPAVVLIMIFEAANFGSGDILRMTLISSPFIVPFLNEVGEVEDLSNLGAWLTVVLNMIFYGFLLYFIRSFTLKHAARLLGRSEDDWK